jgi:hypothetical protein
MPDTTQWQPVTPQSWFVQFLKLYQQLQVQRLEALLKKQQTLVELNHGK